MHVYANTFRIEGPDAYELSLRTILGWLRQKLYPNLQLSDITHDGELEARENGGYARLRCSYSGQGEPELYAWRLKHSDTQVRGRQWNIEMGLKVELEAVEFSCSVQVEAQSTLVTNNVEASSPRIIRYFRNNIANSESHVAIGVPGLSLKNVGQDLESYRALQFDIERKNRDYPILIVSPKRTGQYLVECENLQEQLFGLAQVVMVDSNFNSYEMEEMLGRNMSAWDGAINILHTPDGRARIRNTLMRSEEIEAWGDRAQSKISKLLGLVTDKTNIPRLRELIRFDGVERLALKRRLDAFRARRTQDSPASISPAEMDMLWVEIERLETQLKQACDERDAISMRCMQLEDEKLDIDSQLRSANYRIKEISRSSTSNGEESELVNALLIFACQQDSPAPADVLKLIESVYPERCVVLDSAHDSAADMHQFGHGRRLLDMLRRLMTEYYEAIQTGGDNQARKVFSADEYSATESETVINSKTLREARAFYFDGKPIEMFRHLKIGKADDLRKTIRVHFAWLHENRKIVIGHCGEHLPISSH